MPSIQVKNVPDDVHRKLRTRAAAAGQSLQGYLRANLIEQARRETNAEVFARVEERLARDNRANKVTTESIVDIIREDRDSH